MQEVSKIEKSKELDDDALMYVPKVWWYSKLEWVTQFMKSRNDPATPLSSRLDKSTKLNHSSYDLYTEEEENDEGSKIEVEEIYEQKAKRPRRTLTATSEQPQTRTIQYIISNDDTAEIIAPQEDEILEIQPHSQSDGDKDNERYKKRSKNFGKYVASLMQDFKDDATFFETQNEILQIIQKATLKKYQVRSNK